MQISSSHLHSLRSRVQKNSKYFFLSLVALILFLPFEWGIAAGLVFLIGLQFSGNLGKLLRSLPHKEIFWAFIFLQMLSSLIYGNLMGLAGAAGFAIVGLLAAAFGRTAGKDGFVWWSKLVALLSSGMAFAGFWEFVLLKQQSEPDAGFGHVLMNLPESCRIRTVYDNPNLYAAMIVFFILLCAFLFLHEKGWKKRLPWMCAAGVNLAALVLTGCRSALAVVPFALPVFFWYRGSRKTLTLSLMAEGALGGVILLFPTIIPRFGVTASITARFRIWSAALRYLDTCFLLGGGQQHYGQLSAMYGLPPAPHAHNMILDGLLSFGIVGSILLLLWVLSLVLDGVDGKTWKEMPLFRPLVLAVMMACMIEGLVDCMLNFPQTALLFFCLLSFPLASHRKSVPIAQKIGELLPEPAWKKWQPVWSMFLEQKRVLRILKPAAQTGSRRPGA